MLIRTRLLTTLLLCGLAPMTIVGVIGHHQSRSMSLALETEATGAIQERAKEQLRSVASSRRADLAHYFQAIGEHLASLSGQHQVRDCLVSFGEQLTDLTKGADDAQVAAARAELANYYTRDFENEYRRQNADRPSGIDNALRQLDAPAVLAQLLYVQRNPNQLGRKHLLDTAGDASAYSRLHAAAHPDLRAVQQAFGYYDLFLVDKDGRVVYSVFKELDFATSLSDGPWADTGLGSLYQRLRKSSSGDVLLGDYGLYEPSYDQPASFAGVPVRDGDQTLGYLVVQLPIDRINEIAGNHDGMGETGEFLAIGPDFRMRTDSRRSPKTHSVQSSFRDPEHGSLDTPQVREALAGSSGSAVLQNPDGTEDVCFWAPMDLFGMRWAVLTRFSGSELLESVANMREHSASAAQSMFTWMLTIVLAAGAIIAASSWMLSRRLVTPIRGTIAALQDIAGGGGDLTARLPDTGKDEMAELAGAFNRLMAKLQESMRTLAHRSTGVGSAASELTATAEALTRGADQTKAQTNQVAAAAEELSASMREVHGSIDTITGLLRSVAAAVEEMSITSNEVTRGAERAATVADKAAELSRSSNTRISNLGVAANEIGRVIETIQDIAEQTNLLALNATIEASRAGEAGKGFAVVANEVKDLARQTAEATQDIRRRIERIQSATQESVASIAEIDNVISQVNDESKAIARSVAEQRQATQEMAEHLAENSRRVESVAGNIQEVSTTTQDISRAVNEVDANAQQTAAGAQQTSAAGNELSQLAHDLMAIVGQFRI